ncbi:MAG: metal ABC transporter substrate-binding protein [SAR202 cluster bacterium]|nr:metal ABC transporter substrate-binding protein [SAR202 cluster bacterium]
MPASKYNHILMLFFLLLLIACKSNDPEKRLMESDNSKVAVVPDIRQGSKLRILSSTPIIADWINQVGGNRLTAKSIIPYSVDPHGYNLGAKDFAEITESNHVFTVGLNYEGQWLAEFLDNHPDIERVALGNVVSPLQYEEIHPHNHEHGGYDPHFWFDPNRVITAITKIVEELSKIDPEGSDFYQSRASRYMGELENLDKYIFTEFARIPAGKRKIMTEHESLRYLADRYKIEILEAVIPNINSEVGPTPKNLVTAIESIKQHDIQVIFLESSTDNSSAKTVADETGIKTVYGLSVETLKVDQTYIDFMKSNLGTIVSNIIETPY